MRSLIVMIFDEAIRMLILVPQARRPRFLPKPHCLVRILSFINRMSAFYRTSELCLYLRREFSPA